MWKFSTSFRLTSPVDLVSTRVACQSLLSARVCVLKSVVPASVAATVADGAVRAVAEPLIV